MTAALKHDLVVGRRSMTIKRLFWDIETSPNVVLSWRCGYKLTIQPHQIVKERAIICICYKWEGTKKVHSLQWDNGDDADMLGEFCRVLDEADELVAHNGDKFDLRWFNGRCLIHGLPPVQPVKTVDTLKIARKHFYLNSNRLDYLGKLLCGNGKTHTDFDMWYKIALENDEASLKKMVRYCKNDVTLLEKVWEKLRDYGTPITHAAVKESGDNRDRWKCAHCASSNVKKSKTRVTAAGTVQHQMQCTDCGRYYSIPNKAFDWYLRSGD